ncbi:Permease of the drug/metabolite transporter (DMT) superfamily [Chishuiella changwenlii]|uniref:Membrane protein n=1 Tax=Chishuiella changwenlii TaxID=1434701 RepID=A0A1M6U692_9FLAO|nr:EamA family transporter [Chishuiella changwenlii]GGE99803.1 membrane protein [Chishuiella changwenlii]SHK64772.1 Permease of the drug/metabolite transporter (DMT) superfamily [Chishuiella changwenlii]
MKGNQPNKWSVIFAYFVVYVVWGSTYFFIDKALHGFSPFILGSFRFIAASTILMGFCKMKGYKLWNKQVIKQCMFTGFMLLFIDMAGIIWSEQFLPSGIVAIMAASAAIWFVVLDKPKWKQNFSSLPTILGLVFGFLGVLMLFYEQTSTAHIDPDQQFLNMIGLIVLVFCSIAWTLGSLYSKYAADKQKKEIVKSKEDLHIMVKTAWQMITAGVLFNLVAICNGEYARFNFSNVATQDWLSMAYLITFGSILAFGSYVWLLQVRPALEVSTYAYVNPIVAVALSYFFTDDVVTELQIYGLIVILFSVLLMNWSLYKNTKPIQKLINLTNVKRYTNAH